MLVARFVAVELGEVGRISRIRVAGRDAMARRQEEYGFVSKLHVAYVEIFGAEVTDLLREGAHAATSAFVFGLLESAPTNEYLMI